MWKHEIQQHILSISYDSIPIFVKIISWPEINDCDRWKRVEWMDIILNRILFFTALKKNDLGWIETNLNSRRDKKVAFWSFYDHFGSPKRILKIWRFSLVFQVKMVVKWSKSDFPPGRTQKFRSRNNFVNFRFGDPKWS